jgi:hypothetical protein
MNFVDYDQSTFLKLYHQGSLFVQHMLLEGKLVWGSADSWADLRSSFRIQKDFAEEIEEHLALYRWIKEPTEFKNAEYPLLSHAFRALKNLSIFSMAQRHTYVFEKREVLAKFLPNVPAGDIELLINANRIYERNLESSAIPLEAMTQSALSELFHRIDRALDRSIPLWSR